MVHDGVLRRFHNPLAVLNRQAEVTIKQPLPPFVYADFLPATSPNSFWPSIVIVHSTAIVASSIKAIKMAQPALTVREPPRKGTSLSSGGHSSIGVGLPASLVLLSFCLDKVDNKRGVRAARETRRCRHS